VELLTNPSFEADWHHPSNIPELQIPNGWRFWYREGHENPHSEDVWNKFVRPEVRVLLREQLPEAERELFILQGDQVLKIFKGHGAWFGGLSQYLQLEPGTYRFTVKVYADLVKEYNDAGKVWADDPDQRDGLARFMFNTKGQDWQPLRPGAWNTLALDFLAPEHEFGLGIDFMCPFALANSGVFCDDWSLVKIAEPGTRGAPRTQYDRTVHVLPETATLEQALRVFEIAWKDGHQTVGGSYDDAGIGDLDYRAAILWGIPDEEQEQYHKWYNNWYPDVLVEFQELP
jgi:hypothetical protein